MLANRRTAWAESIRSAAPSRMPLSLTARAGPQGAGGLDFDSLGVRAPNPTHYRFALLVYANSSLNCHEPETFLAAMLNSEQMGFGLAVAACAGWKRFVVTVGERIGKEHLTYGQGASAELVAMVTIGAADAYGLPASTTHVLSLGMAGTIAANGSGFEWGTGRSVVLTWVLTLPASIALAGSPYWVFRLLF